MANRGVVPLDPDSAVGQVRLNVGDTETVPLDPAEAGFGSYDYFSDNDIAAFLTTGGASTPRATGYAYLRLAANAAMTSANIKTDDLLVSTDKRAGDLRAIAKEWFDAADAADTAAVNDIFDIVPFVGRPNEYEPYVPTIHADFDESTTYPGYLLP